MSSLYSTLEESKTELRFITLHRISGRNDIVQCQLEVQSLSSLSAQHKNFISASGCSNLSPRMATSKWALSGLSWDAELSRCSQVPRRPEVLPKENYRFTWGDYAALSYVWGNEKETRTIMVNGHRTEVTANLENALRVFSEQGEFREGFKLWADAICINQKDLEERALQVQRMREIYGSAWTVIAWLGEEADQSEKAINFVHELAAYGRAETGHAINIRLQQEPRYLGTGCWLALQELMERPYWYRLWIIQEVIMGASAVVIRCGRAKVDWTSFCQAVALLEEHLWLVKDDLLQRDILAYNSNRREAWSVDSLHLIHQDLSILSDNEEHGGAYLSFGRILDIANTAECIDSRDKVYALIGLMEGNIADQLSLDYRLDPSRVYAETAKAFIKGCRNLDPIREGNPWGPTNCPSWAADWLWEGRVRSSRTENQLWGPKWLSEKLNLKASHYVPYRASGETVHDAIISEDCQFLTCSGFIVDSISGLSARGNGYFNWIKASITQPTGWESAYGDIDATTEALYHTLVLDRVSGGEKASSRHSVILHLPTTFSAAQVQFKKLGWDWLASQEWYYFRWEMWRIVNKDFRLGRLRLDDFFTDEIPSDASEFDMTEVYCCFDRSSQKRRFMTTRKGYMGWVPDNIYGRRTEQTRQGDLIAIIFGCSMPVVIRPWRKYFLVIGEAYVQGLMDGEALKLLENGDVKLQKFTLC